jgi:uncharacterized protein (TIGR03083 family)
VIAVQDKTTMQMACEERQDFVDFLDGLSPEQWEQPSLCELWRVRDVVAHVISYEELSRWQLVRRFAKGGFVPPRVNAIGVAEYTGRSPKQLTHLMRTCIPPRGLTSAFGGMIALVDGMIHQQDIRRALGQPRVIPPERLHRVLNNALSSPATRGARRTRGVRLIATDLDWAHGDGPEVTGPAEAVLMAMTARPDAYQSAGAHADSAMSTLSSTGSSSLRPQAVTIRATIGWLLTSRISTPRRRQRSASSPNAA